MSGGYWDNDSVCGDPVWHEYPTFTFEDAAYQCSKCPIEDGKVWRNDLYMGMSVPHYPVPNTVDKTGRCPCQTNCPLCFSGPLIG